MPCKLIRKKKVPETIIKKKDARDITGAYIQAN